MKNAKCVALYTSATGKFYAKYEMQMLMVAQAFSKSELLYILLRYTVSIE